MNNTNKYLGIAIIAVAIIGVGLFLKNSDANAPATPNAMMEQNTMENSAMMQENAMMNEGKNGDTMNQEDAMMMAKTTDTYTISDDSQVAYVLQKKWLNKPTEEVVGTNPNVTGSFVYNAETKTIEGLTVTIDSQTFSSGSEGRDKEVQKYFQGPITVKNIAPITDVSVGDINKTVPVDITINEKSQTIDLTITGTMTETGITATGKGLLTLSKAGVKAPSLLNIYSVDDVIGITMTMNATK